MVKNLKITIFRTASKMPVRNSYNTEVLLRVISRDKAILLDAYDKTTKRTMIKFMCHCGQEGQKSCIGIISRTGAFCKKCTKSNAIIKIQKTRNAQCNITSLYNTIKRDNAEQLIKYESITKSTYIKFKCNCGEESEKNCFQLIMVSGAFCEKCTREHWTENTKKTNLERYNVECTAQVPCVKEKIIESNLKNYGVENVFQSKIIQEQIKQVILERYNVEHPSQCQEIQEKTQKNARKFKEYKMPSGEIRKVQGYEIFALDELVKLYKETDIITDRKGIPRIAYKIDDKQKYYFPDIYIKSINKIIEVKSTWTYQCKDDNIQEKADATILKGYDYEIWIYDAKGNKTIK